MSRSLASFYFSLEDLLTPLQKRFGSLEAVEYLVYRYGWTLSLDVAEFGRVNQALAFRAPLEEFLAVASTIRQQFAVSDNALPDPQVFSKLMTSATSLIDAIVHLKSASFADLAAPLSDEDFWGSIAEHLLDDLLEEYLRVYQPRFYLPLRLGGVIQYKPMSPTEPFRQPYTKITFNWGQLGQLLTDPLNALKSAYHWGGVGGASFAHENLLESLTAVLRAMNVATRSFAPGVSAASSKLIEGTGYSIANAEDALRITLLDGFSPRNQVVYEVGMELYPAKSSTAVADPDGLILRTVARGGAGGELPLNKDLTLRWQTAASADDVIGLAIFPDKLVVLGSALAVGVNVEIQGPTTRPVYLLGNLGSARIELIGPSVKLSISGTVDDPEATLHLGTHLTKAVLPLDEADSFVGEMVPKRTVDFSFSPELIWSSSSGFTFNGNARLDFTLPMSISIGPIKLTAVNLYLGPDRENSKCWQFQVGVSLTGNLGPVKFVVDNIGAAWTVTPYQRHEILSRPTGSRAPRLGSLDVDANFAPPSGVGLIIDASVVVGGGFLRFDPQKEEYSGMLELQIAETIAVKGIGLLTTRMPDGGKGYSLVIIIFAQGFAPIQLGLGFTLTGIGGLLAINRTFDQDVLRAGLKNHTLDSILFPKDPIRNAPQIISNLNRVFPPANGHHLFGPMAQIAWGTPTLITANLALVLEFGARLRLLILAQVVAILPNRENDLLRLQMDAIGVIDFDQGTASLDATLYDSRLLKKFVLTGDMAMRLKWEAPQNFALAVGGLHPAFNPPPNFPKLERIALNLSAGDNPRLCCEAYFALTSNTVQFGARTELYVSVPPFSIQGETGYDVLIQRNPFHFDADYYAQLLLKRGSTNLFKVRVEGALAGPRPLHIKGKATFEILWCDFSIRFDKTLVEGELPPSPEPIDVLPLLKEALGNPGNWKGQLPDGQRPMVSLRPRPRAATEVLLHPLGTLTVKQGIVPLDLDISRFGQAAPVGARRFTITSDSLGDHNQTPQPVKDFFARAEFFEMSDDEKLSSPSFEPMAAGVSIGSDKFVFTDDWLEVKTIDFETITVDIQQNTSHHSGPKDLYTLSPELLDKQALFGAAGNCDVRRTGKAKYRTTKDKYRIEKKGWTIVATDDLTVQPLPGIEVGKPASYSEAAQALHKLKQENPAKAGGFKILRPSELL